jgi:4-carboxymuconolactone decarboxylase
VDPRDEELLRRLALNDESTIDGVLRMHPAAANSLDPKSTALVRLAGLIALRSAPASYGWSVTAALAAGATEDEIIGVLVAIAPVVGTARVAEASLPIASALGCEVDLPDWA